MVNINQYEDFILLASSVVRVDDKNIWKIYVQVLESPVGENEAIESELNLSDLNLRRLDRRGLDEQGIINLGENISKIILPNEVRDLFLQSLERVPPEYGLRLVLRFDDRLASIPWEYLYVPQKNGERDATGFLALNKRISIVRDIMRDGDPKLTGDKSRYGLKALLSWLFPPKLGARDDDKDKVVANTPEAAPPKREKHQKPRLLATLSSASPEGYKPLDVEREERNIDNALKNIPGITLEWLKNPTIKQLQSELAVGYDIFHFAGHGKFRESVLDTSGGAIFLVDEQGKPAPIEADQLAINLRNVQLVVLNACETGRRDEWSGVVTKLVKNGIPAAVAMQYKIWDESAIAFSYIFYRVLALGQPLDRAVSEGRLAIYNLCNPLSDDEDKKKYWRDWGVPVLYWRGKENFVLPVDADENQRQAMESELDKYRISQKSNPFGKRGRIDDPNEFFDREYLLSRLFEHLRKNENCVLVGDRQMGKSSILSMVSHWGPQLLKLPPESFIEIDMANVYDEDDFFKALCGELDIPTSRGYKLAKTLQLRGKRYILCLDTFEKQKKERFTGDEWSELRGLADGNDVPFKLAIASRLPLNEVFENYPQITSPLENICRQLNVGPFSEKEAREFLDHRLRGTGVSFTESEIDELLENTKCHPARLQKEAAILYDIYIDRKKD